MTSIPIPDDAIAAAREGIPACREALARAADPTRRFRTLHDREQIAELTTAEYDADTRAERLADAIAAEDGAA